MTTKKPLQIVEIDFDQCTRTYGSSPCTAVLGTTGVRKCFGTNATCQDKDNYDKGTLTLRFAMAQDGLPKDTLIFPVMTSKVSGASTEINLGGVNNRTGPLGKRGVVNVSLKDFTYHDRGIDPYATERVDGTAQTDEGGYDPATRSTALRKLVTRNPYYIGRPLRVLDGYVGEALGSMRTRHYVITGWTGPDSAGNINVEAKDLLSFADDKNAQCPKPSQGKLAADISDTYVGTVDLIPASIGDTYAASGRICSGSEVFSFTRSGDTLTIVERGLDGTTAESHSADSLAQECYHVDGVRIEDVAADILENYADVDSARIPIADWQAEGLRWAPDLILTATITEPTGVTSLIGELAQHGLFFWHDRVANEIKMRFNRPKDIGEATYTVTDDKDVIAGTLQVERMDEKRLSQVVFAYDIIDPTKSHTDLSNYNSASAPVDLVAEGANEYDKSQYQTFYSRWLGPTGGSSATSIAQRYLNRFRDPPSEVTYEADIDGVANYDVADLIDMQSRVLVDDVGLSLPTNMKVLSSHETAPGARVKVRAQTSDFSGRYGFITGNSRGDYSASSAAEQLLGTYIVDETALEFPDGSGPYLFF